MAKAKLVFHKCIQDSQDYGSDDERMVSRVFFTLTVAGNEHPDLYADIKQTVGSKVDTSAELCAAAHYSAVLSAENSG